MTPPVITAQRARGELLDREEALARDMVRLYRVAETRLQARIEQLRREIPTVEIDTVERKQWALARLEALLQQTQEELRLVSARAGEITENAQAANIAAATTDVAALASSLGIEASFSVLPAEALQELAGRMRDGTPLAQRFAREGDDAAQRMRDTLFGAMAEGKGPAAIARELTEAVQALTRGNALLIARTESIRAYREAHIRQYQANPGLITGWRWLASKSVRTCPVCLALDGTIHPLTEEFGSHPACRCCPTPVTIADDPGRWGETGQQWFTRQPPAVQEQMLGTARYRLYRDGKISLPDLVDRHPSVWGPTANLKSLNALIRESRLTADEVRQARRTRRARVPDADVPALNPLGIPVSKALSLPHLLANNRQAMKHAVKLIDRVHGDGALPKTAIRSKKLPVSQHGITYGWFDPRLTPHEIAIQRFGTHPHPIMTTLHEVGHLLDLRGIPGRGYSSQTGALHVEKWREAIYNTRRYRELEALGDPYLLQGSELFARSYAQFIAVKTGDTAVAQELHLMRTYEPLKVWDDDDFQPVHQAFEELCQSLNWSA